LRLSLSAKALFLVLAPLGFEIAFVLLLINLSGHADYLAQRLQDSQDMISAADRVLALSVDLVLNVSASKTRDAAETPGSALTGAPDLERKLRRELSKLEVYTARYSSRSLSQFIRETDGLLNAVIPQIPDGSAGESGRRRPEIGPDAAGTFLRSLESRLAALCNSEHQFLLDEEEVHRRLPELEVGSSPEQAVLRSAAALSERQLRAAIQILLGAGILANLLIAWWLNHSFNKSTISRLSALMDNSKRIALREPLTPMQPSSDEIGALSSALERLSEELSAARKKELAAVDNAVDIICSVAATYSFSWLSPSVEANLGYAAAELSARNCLDLAADDEARTALKDCLDRARVKQSESAEIFLTRKNLERGCFIWSVFWSEDEQSYFCVVQDISERRKAEEELVAAEKRMRSLVHKMPAGLIAFNENGEIETVNEAMARMLASPEKQPAVQSLADLFEGDAYQMAKSFLLADGKKDQLIRDLRMRRLTGEGSFSIEALITCPESDGAQKRIAVIEDMSESRELERTRRELLATLTHDLRAPLASVKASLNLLSAGLLGSLSEPGRQKADRAEKAASELIELINSVLETARLYADKQILEHELVDLNELCLDLFDDLSRLCLEHSVRIDYKSQDGFCLGHLDKLYRALHIMTRRSIERATPGATIFVELSRQENMLALKISDPALTESESFQFQYGAAGSQDVQGEAELSLARAIIKAHGGHVLVAREDGQTLLCVLLPSKGREGA
jgi:PAS domain S-box-containing protein